MKIPRLNRKELLLFATFLLCVTIICVYGIFERVHPDEHHIEFATVLAQPDDITCGPTSAAMILCHYGKRVSADEVKVHSNTVWFRHGGKDIGMTSPDYLSKAMTKLGVPATVKYGNIHTLKHHVAQDRPCIVLVRSGETTWHYIVVRGFTPEKVEVADPSGGLLYEMTLDRFAQAWAWDADLDGNPVGNAYLRTLLRAAEVYPHTYICPDSPKGK